MLDAVSTFGPFVFDREQLKLTRDGRAVSLGGRGSALLAALVDAKGGVVSKDALMQAAWPGTVVEEANLNVQIGALRRALGTGPDEREWIITVPRVGYRLVLQQRTADSGPPAVAVLPFENLSSDPEQGFLADGLVEEIITALSRFRTFAVVARNSTFAHKGRAVDVREVARDLGVRYVLEGSVRRSGDKVRVAAQLVEGASGAHLWAEKFEGAVSDIFDFQDEITRSVIGLIEPQIRKAEIERARHKRPESLDAWDLYIQAVPLVYAANVAGFTQAIHLLDRALALAPDYAPALAFASWAHEKRYAYGGAAQVDVDVVETALALAQRAVKADPDDAMAMALLGWERILFRRDYAALALCVHAVELNPNSRAVLDLAAVAHLFAGDLNEMLSCSVRALQLSPGATDAYACIEHIAAAHFHAGRFEEAAEWSQRSIDLEKDAVFNRLQLATSLAHLGRIDQARAEMTVALALRPDFTIASHVKDDPQRFPDRKKRWIDGLRLAGMPEG
jgi:TolB-like protein/Flp pilus assembly protein TadD